MEGTSMGRGQEVDGVLGQRRRGPGRGGRQHPAGQRASVAGAEDRQPGRRASAAAGE